MNMETNANASDSVSENCNIVASSNSVEMMDNESQVSEADEEDICHNCLVLADTTLKFMPKHVSQLMQYFNTKSLSQSELVFLLVYVIAVECGFSTVSEYNKYADSLFGVQTSSSFHLKNVLRLCKYQKPTYAVGMNKTCFFMHLQTLTDNVAKDENTINVLRSLLSAYVTGDFALITATSDFSANVGTNRNFGFSVCISMPRYVHKLQPKNKPIQQRLCKLDEFAYLMREKLFVPMRNSQLGLLDVPSYPSLLGLPPEIYDGIFRFLTENELKIVANVNQLLYHYSMNSKYRNRAKK